MKSRRGLLYAGAVLLVVGVGIAAMLLSEEPATGTAAEVDHHIAAVMDDIAARSMADPDSVMSSNPYDYAAGGEFEQMVALGTPALPVIEQRIAASGESGLREYLLAIAAERIAKVDLKGGVGAWQTGKEWPARWRAHLKKVPSEVRSIAASKSPPEEKHRRIVALGTPAIPFVMDEVASGREELSPALEELASDTAELRGARPWKATPAWARANKHRFAQMRSLAGRAR